MNHLEVLDVPQASMQTLWHRITSLFLRERESEEKPQAWFQGMPLGVCLSPQPTQGESLKGLSSTLRFSGAQISKKDLPPSLVAGEHEDDPEFPS